MSNNFYFRSEVEKEVKTGSGGMLPATAAAKSLQSCPTLCDPIDGSPPGSTILGSYIYCQIFSAFLFKNKYGSNRASQLAQW